MDQIMTDICEQAFAHNNIPIDWDVIRSKSKRAEHVMQRKICVMALRQAKYGWREIGEFLNRSHCSVLHLYYHCPYAKGWLVEIPSTEKMDMVNRIQFHKKQILMLENKLKGAVVV